MIGEKVLHYEIRERLGRGGMGVVYKARDTRLDRWVALKFLPQHTDEDPLVRERLVREAKAASALQHPHICTIHEIGETDDGQLFICMAYYDGPNLRALMHQGEIPLDRGVEMGRQLCHALARAHQAGIVHRDLKPSNIMTTSQGDIAIVDFGLAKLAGEISLTKTGATLGTTAYMSPEQIRGEQLDYRTDLWSLGVILYQLITGRFPFGGDYDEALRRSIQEDEPAAPSRVRDDLPPHVDAFMARLLAKDRNERFGSAAEIEQALLAVVHPQDSEIPTQLQLPSSRPTWRPGRRARLALGGAVAVVAALLLVWPLRSPKPAAPTLQSVAVLPFSNFTGDDAKSYISDGVAAGLITALSEVGGLTVLSRSEAWTHRDEDWGARKLGERLGVGLLLEGAVQGKTDSIAVKTELIDAPSGAVLWTEEVTGSVNDLPEMTRQIAGRLTEVLSIRLSDRERRRLSRDPTKSFQAYEYYLRGQQYLADRYQPEDLDASIELFKQAIRVDPDFALAHAALSEAHWEVSRRDGDAEALVAATRAAEAALALDPELPAALVARARVERSHGRYVDSIAALEDALATHPNPATAHRELARSYVRGGDLESAEAALRAATLVGGDNWMNWNALGAFLWRRGDYEEAREAFLEAVARAPVDISTPALNLAANELSSGNFEQAIDALERLPLESLSPNHASNLGTAYYFSDRPDKWAKARRYYELAVKLAPRNDVLRRNMADLYLELGETRQARAQYLEAARLAEERLRSDSTNWDLRLQKALYTARAEDCEAALRQVDGLASEIPETGPNEQQMAYVYALCGRREAALEAIRRAVDLGVPPALIRQEGEFASLHEDPDFQRFTAER